MEGSPLDRHAASPLELRERLAAEGAGLAFLVYRDGDGQQRIHPLGRDVERVVLGRGAMADLRLGWDPEVSRAHAELTCKAGSWYASDDGLSANGTWVDGELLRGRRRLDDGDTLRLGRTVVAFRAPADAGEESTVKAGGGEPPRVSDAQRRVLVALARPYAKGAGFATPATNQDIAAECVITVDAVKAHLRALFDRFGIADLPQNRKRARLVELAFLYGVVNEREL